MERLSKRQKIAAAEGHPEWGKLPQRAIDAEAWGVDAYFPGTACSAGHIAPRRMYPVRKCIVCAGVELPADDEDWRPTSAQRIEALNGIRMSMKKAPDYDMVLEGEVVLSTTCFGDWTVPVIRERPITLRDVLMTLDYLHTREFDDHRFVEGIEITVEDGVTTVELHLGS